MLNSNDHDHTGDATARDDVLSNPHVLVAILEQVGARDLAHATAVSTVWRQEGCANALWRAHCLEQKHFMHPSVPVVQSVVPQLHGGPARLRRGHFRWLFMAQQEASAGFWRAQCTAQAAAQSERDAVTARRAAGDRAFQRIGLASCAFLLLLILLLVLLRLYFPPPFALREER